MERYVWELTLQLKQLGYPVTVVCERCHVEKPEGISVYELGEVAQRPSWVAALRFDWRVVRWLAANPQADRLIHSHERISSHDITTFHSPPFATVFEKRWWKLISLRVKNSPLHRTQFILHQAATCALLPGDGAQID